MTRLNRSTLLVGLLLLGLLASLPASADDLSLEEILDNYYEAIGGKDAWLAIKTMRATGKMQMGPMEAPFTVTAARPSKIRIEFEVQGMKGIQAFDGENGWMLMPFMGSTEPEPMPDEMVDMMRSDMDIEGVLINHEDKGHEIELVGKEEIEGTDTYHLKVTLESDNVIDYFLDSEYFIPIATKAKNSIQGMEIEATTTLSDYKEVDGIMIPHSVVSSSNMGEQAMTTDSVELNVEVDESIFVMPEKAAKKEDN